MKTLLTLLALIFVTSCTKQTPPASVAPPITAGSHSTVMFSAGACPVKAVTFTITNAPPAETALQRWKRVKANYDAASAAQETLTQEIMDCDSQTEQSDLPYFEALQDAEKALESAKCGQICVPVRTP